MEYFKLRTIYWYLDIYIQIPRKKSKSNLKDTILGINMAMAMLRSSNK